MHYYNYKRLFSFRKFSLFLGLGYVRWTGNYKKLFSFGRKLFFFFTNLLQIYLFCAWVWTFFQVDTINSDPKVQVV